MKTKLTKKERFIIGLTLFGMFFGAGNLIFPIHLGQLAGKNVVPATFGFIITGVTIPILAVAAIGITHSKGLQDMCNKKVGKGFGYLFTCLLYLTIGPFFAIPRCCTTTFTSGVYPLLNSYNEKTVLLIFSFIFFSLVLFFSLKPTEITKWVGKIITPCFLILLAVLVISSLVNPGARIMTVTPVESYETGYIFQGVLEGYNTMDAIAGLAFGIIVVNCIKDLGIEDDEDIAMETIKSGVITAIFMGIIYFVTTIMGTQSRGLFEVSDNGGIAFAQVAEYYLGKPGLIILAFTIGLACLKTAIGLVTSCAKTFEKMFNSKVSYNTLAIIFSVFSFAVSNVGLTTIINYSVPMLMLLYPIAIVLIILCMFSKLIKGKLIYRTTLIGAGFAAIIDFIRTLPFGIDVSFMAKFLPLYDVGFSWLVPSLIGLMIGIGLSRKNNVSKR